MELSRKVRIFAGETVFDTKTDRYDYTSHDTEDSRILQDAARPEGLALRLLRPWHTRLVADGFYCYDHEDIIDIICTVPFHKFHVCSKYGWRYSCH